LHEAAHAVTNAPDVSELFEQGLTDFLGYTAAQLVPDKPARTKKKPRKTIH
jgi:hypothetical protein